MKLRPMILAMAASLCLISQAFAAKDNCSFTIINDVKGLPVPAQFYLIYLDNVNNFYHWKSSTLEPNGTITFTIADPNFCWLGSPFLKLAIEWKNNDPKYLSYAEVIYSGSVDQPLTFLSQLRRETFGSNIDPNIQPIPINP